MSSIAYVTDKNMLEYHRLCGNRNINFWRLSAKAGFTDFKKGDLLFFFTYATHIKKKGLVGYAHYDSSHVMSLDRMWKQYEKLNGYDTKEELKNAIIKASRTHEIPEKMNCLYLRDAVFFVSPIYPKELGLKINDKLESYTYIDQEDPEVTVKILRKAEEIGIDVWASSQNFEPEYVFLLDEIRHIFSLVARQIGPCDYSTLEHSKAKKLIAEKLNDGSYEYIRGTDTQLIQMRENKVTVVLPFVYKSKNYQQRLKELLGMITYYQLKTKQYGLRVPQIDFEIVQEGSNTEVKELLEVMRSYE